MVKYRPLGNTGIKVSEIGMGTNTISGVGSHGYVDEADGSAAVQRAYELGVTFFDTAENYSEGRSEVVLGKVLGDKPDAVICTKVNPAGGSLTSERIREAAEASLRRLQRDVIDVYLLQNPPTAMISDPQIKEAFAALQRDGLIRSYGVSTLGTADIEQGEAVLDEGGYTSMEIGMNVAEQKPADTLLPRAHEFGAGVIVRVPLGTGLLTGKYERDHAFPDDDDRGYKATQRADALARVERRFAPVAALRQLSLQEGVSIIHLALGWLLTHEEVSTVISGAKNAVQVADNVAAGDVELSPSAMERLAAMRVQ